MTKVNIRSTVKIKRCKSIRSDKYRCWQSRLYALNLKYTARQGKQTRFIRKQCSLPRSQLRASISLMIFSQVRMLLAKKHTTRVIFSEQVDARVYRQHNDYTTRRYRDNAINRLFRFYTRWLRNNSMA